MSFEPFLADMFVHIPGDELRMADWTPADPEVFDVTLIVEIGWKGSGGTTRFYSRLATPPSLASAPADDSHVISQRAMIVVSRFDHAKIRDAIQRLVERSARLSSEVEGCRFLNRFFQWEYEDSDLA